MGHVAKLFSLALVMTWVRFILGWASCYCCLRGCHSELFQSLETGRCLMNRPTIHMLWLAWFVKRSIGWGTIETSIFCFKTLGYSRSHSGCLWCETDDVSVRVVLNFAIWSIPKESDNLTITWRSRVKPQPTLPLLIQWPTPSRFEVSNQLNCQVLRCLARKSPALTSHRIWDNLEYGGGSACVPMVLACINWMCPWVVTRRPCNWSWGLAYVLWTYVDQIVCVTLSAHEITHAFDDEGILYDQFGAFNPLYDNKTIDEFHLASNCVRNQYSDFEVLTGVKVDGNITLGENIADHGGLKIAEIAYHEWLKSNGRSDSQLPAVDFTHEQLFYLGYALPWCAVHSDNMMRTHIVKDEHAPDKFRVLGPLANSPRFSKAWNCPIGSVMNPESKCKIW